MVTLMLLMLLLSPFATGFVLSHPQKTQVRTYSALTDEPDSGLWNTFHQQKNKCSLEENAALSVTEASLREVTMKCFVASMCVLLPFALSPVWLMKKLSILNDSHRETLALDVAQSCARVALFFMPFCQLTVESSINDHGKQEAPPRLWVCNHTSMLDTFILLAADKSIRGPRKRPIKTVYVSCGLPFCSCRKS
jgi:hypothetical protein